MTWSQILTHWADVEADLHERYGLDVEDDDLMTTRSWRWLRTRITGLLKIPPTVTPDGRAIAATRVGLALFPPSAPEQKPR